MIDSDPVLKTILFAWFVLLGACIGSFLNVVIYRLPLGKSLSDPPSHCPKCNHRIRWFDNVPVLGWLILQGKCRDCKEPISPRYPVVEAISAIVFGAIAGLLLQYRGDASLSEFFCLVLALSCFMTSLLAAGLIEWDKKKIPWKLFLPAIIVGPMVPYLWQESFGVRLFGKLMDVSRPYYPVEPQALILIFILFCLPISFVASWLPDKRYRSVWIFLSALIVVYLGWAAVPVVLFSAIVLLLLYFTPLHQSVPSNLVLALTSFVFILIILLSTPASAPLG